MMPGNKIPAPALNPLSLFTLERRLPMAITLPVRTRTRIEMIDISASVQNELSKGGIQEGLCVVYVPHTTAGITVNEGADPAVCHDILTQLNTLVPAGEAYRHLEGNSDSHIKASLMGSSVVIPFEKGRLMLGTWQKIFFCEFDGPRSRKVFLKIQ